MTGWLSTLRHQLRQIRDARRLQRMQRARRYRALSEGHERYGPGSDIR